LKKILFAGIKKNANKIGVDSTVGFTLLTRIVQAAGGIGSILLIAKYLSGEEQGYYYTFASIIAIQIFFELGLSGIITQYAAHEFAHLTWDVNFNLIGEESYKSRLSSLLRFCVKWFGIISIALFFILIAAGFYFFSTYNKSAVNPEWRLPWILLALATVLNLFIDPVLAFFDGVGQIKEMSKVRLLQKSINVVLLYLLLILNCKLYASAVATLVSVSCIFLILIFTDNIKKIKVVWGHLSLWKVSYLKEIFPYQWRIALSWISGYFIFQLFNPVLFATEGPRVAGQMGMSLQILNGISALSMSWITTKIPLFSSLIAYKNYQELNVIFKKTLANLMFINLLMIFCFYLFYLVVYYNKLNFSNRFLPPVALAMLCLATIINQLIFSWATYLRCHKQEPFLINSMVGGLLCCLSTVFLGRYFGLYGIVAGYTFLTVFMGLPWSFYIFKTKKLLWHN
jgi:O-antigen/teichoic acid export membrane protein